MGKMDHDIHVTMKWVLKLPERFSEGMHGRCLVATFYVSHVP